MLTYKAHTHSNVHPCHTEWIQQQEEAVMYFKTADNMMLAEQYTDSNTNRQCHVMWCYCWTRASQSLATPLPVHTAAVAHLQTINVRSKAGS